ncbi:hypothetical protein A1O1_02045 [Capronia coronata CBS 617.96]|uniref:Regulator of volume decrease after cellular swelling-domain-containing protein n=1 Tax=Capronia coronata CBS 617.96 TaxID=1182541 RepID=W9YM62_9EURO|nr:uncharacterized protein A1O1_02045 [Capronia coronata CBS 617.96]EXJ93653.1 hypothetical protein A1O1_02045 [Capronia coronata CBS 617.96]
MEVLRDPPKASTFVPLHEHQSATPASFYTGPPVLHYYSDRSKLIVLEPEISDVAAFAPLLEHSTTQSESDSHANGTETDGHAADHQAQQKVVEDLDVWVTSDKLYLYSNSAAAGVSIPYPSISLHAIQSLPEPSVGEQQGLYMQLVSSTEASAGQEDTEPESVSITIVPTASAPPAAATEDDPAEDKPEQTPVMAMFAALSNCSNLHPDPVEPGEEEDEEGVANGGVSRLIQAGLAFPGASDGGLPPAMPGSGGWITAENMHEFVDENGDWIDDQEGEAEPVAEDAVPGLGPGAGTVRTRVEDEHGNGEAGDDADETKWRRTS